ncbi:hypothetical protein CGT92_12245 [Vibrio metoecus]|nr:hypothetical protein XV91_08230 [Vibrio metoecus]PAR55997.1 hypothetical protein CGT92_12245 [Vibrio metoecus]
MRFRLIKPNHADFNVHLNTLKPAFEGSPDAKGEFITMSQMIRDRKASFYHAKNCSGGVVRFVGYADDSIYHIYALAGHGLTQIAPSIIQKVKDCRYSGIRFHTYKNGMRRILRRFGFKEVHKEVRTNGTCESVHILTWSLNG